ncbi:GNAT family N-acetyltransferase [Vallitalea okinawensis]|uniref:GNAT family N-acetyltransferase n=1 Tax=Vallitalea okinawensis TaxID=2078660 RepID=UPI000CFB55FF|nr:GNAT family N-acetyltransferase [Vallitalea okinawensis]
MLDKIKSAEVAYITQFTENDVGHEVIRYYDDKLPDMYMHNFTFIKEGVSKESIRNIILDELNRRKTEKADFLRVDCNFSIDAEIIESLPQAPDVEIYDFMYIEPKMGEHLHGNEGAIIKKAISEKVLKEGKDVDILANQSNMGTEFAHRRIERKSEIYNQQDSGIDLFVCYDNDIPVGNCELMLHNDIAKIEDFDILESHQRKGFGTSVLKHLLKEAHQHGVRYAYLLTDSGDSAKEMYKKCGFKKVGVKTELFFELNQ